MLGACTTMKRTHLSYRQGRRRAYSQGNGMSYPPRRDLPLSRGVEARLLYNRGAWLQVQLASGEVGWLARSDVLVNSQP